MAQIYETDEQTERVLLVGVALDDSDEAQRSLDELKELAKTAGAVTMSCHLRSLKILKMPSI